MKQTIGPTEIKPTIYFGFDGFIFSIKKPKFILAFTAIRVLENKLVNYEFERNFWILDLVDFRKRSGV
jgi:hypothetical protein